MREGTVPTILSLVFVPYWFSLALAPHDRAVWFAENVPVVLVFLLLVHSLRRLRLSDAAYALAFVWLFLHTLGGHYTFERVPFDLVTRALGFTRNHFDRFAHFSIGLYAFPIAEIMERRGLITVRPVLHLFALFSIMSLAAAYEIIEWWYAALAGGEQGAAFLGSQGDPWDAQKDMLMDTLGALLALAVFAWRGRRRGSDLSPRC